MSTTWMTEGDVESAFKRVGQELQKPQLQTALQQSVNEVQAHLVTTFENETDPAGNHWTPWQLRSVHDSDSKKTLQSSGLLLSSIRDDMAQHVETVTEDTAILGTRVPYAYKHQEGGIFSSEEPLVGRGGQGWVPSGTPINIPRREFLGITDAMADQIANTIGEGFMVRLDQVL